MTVERDVIIKTLQAARKASEASLLAIAAVEKMLTEPDQTATEVGDAELEKRCDHSKAVSVNAGGGSYLVCPCGEQIEQ
jgi:hypothetical protein